MPSRPDKIPSAMSEEGAQGRSDLPPIADGPAFNQSTYYKGSLAKNIAECALIASTTTDKKEKYKNLVALAGWQYGDCRYEDSLATCAKILAENPDSYKAYYQMGIDYQRQCKFDQALANIEKANTLKKNAFAGLIAKIKNQQYDYEHRVSDPAKRWLLATTAILFTVNGDGLNTITGVEPGPINSVRQRASILSWWQIKDRKGLLEVLQSLVEGGHNQSWQEMRPLTRDTLKLDEYTSDRRHPLQSRHQLQLVDRYGADFGDRGLLGWDLCRYMCLCRWGVECGFITEDEGWELMMPVGVKIQKLFTGWEQLGGEYLIGRDFWSHSQYMHGWDKVAADLTWLLKSKQSPWVQLPWDTKLPGAESHKDMSRKVMNQAIYAAIAEVQAHHPAEQNR